jgi:hypothetical protein
MQIVGTGELTVAQVAEEVRRGGRFVYFPYCISLLVVTLRRSSDIHFIRAGEGTFGKSWPYALLSFLLGWWGFPWGFIWTPVALFETLSGGKDVTGQIMQSMLPPGRY